MADRSKLMNVYVVAATAVGFFLLGAIFGGRYESGSPIFTVGITVAITAAVLCVGSGVVIGLARQRALRSTS